MHFLGRNPFNQNFRKFRHRIEWNGNFRKVHFENFEQPLEVVLFPEHLNRTTSSSSSRISSTNSETIKIVLKSTILNLGRKFVPSGNGTSMAHSSGNRSIPQVKISEIQIGNFRGMDSAPNFSYPLCSTNNY